MWQFYHRSFLVTTPQELEMHWQNDTIVAGLMSACVFLLFSLIKKPGKLGLAVLIVIGLAEFAAGIAAFSMYMG